MKASYVAATLAAVAFGVTACGSSGSSGASVPAPQATITGSLVPSTLAVGEQATFTFNVSGENQDLSNFAVSLTGDLADHNTIDRVQLQDGPSAGDVRNCKQDANLSSDYGCGAVKKGAAVMLLINLTAKDPGNWTANVLFQDGTASDPNGVRQFTGDNAVMGEAEVVNAS